MMRGAIARLITILRHAVIGRIITAEEAATHRIELDKVAGDMRLHHPIGHTTHDKGGLHGRQCRPVLAKYDVIVRLRRLVATLQPIAVGTIRRGDRYAMAQQQFIEKASATPDDAES